MPGGGNIKCSKHTVFCCGGVGARGRSDSNLTTAADAEDEDADASAAPSPPPAASVAAARIAARVVSLRRENTRDHTDK